MKIFIDFDGTLYDSHFEDCDIAQMLISYLKAPLFDGAKETIEGFYKNGHECFGVTARGYFLRDEERENTKLRLRKDGFFRGKDASSIRAVVDGCIDKYTGIQYVYENYYKKEIQPEDCILIDDCLEAIVNAADNGVQCILFEPKKEELDEEEQKILNELKISVVHSWQEIKSLVESMCEKHEDPEKEKVEPKSKVKEERTK